MPVLRISYTLHLFGGSCYLFRKYNSFVEINEAHFFLLSLCTGSNTLLDIIDSAYKKFGTGVKKDTFEHSIIEVFIRYSQKGILVESDGTFSRTSCVSGKKGACFPYFVSLELCNYCNLSCDFCYMKSMKNDTSIPLDVVNFFVDNYAGMTNSLQLSGGEPTLHKNFPEIALKVTSKFKTSLITNGTQLSKIDAEILKRFKLIQLSLYGYDKNTYTNFTGNDSAYQQLEAGLLHLKKNNIDALISITITKDNYPFLEKYLKFLKNFGMSNVRFSLVSDLYNDSPYRFNNLAVKNMSEHLKEITERYGVTYPVFEIASFNNRGAVKFNCGAGKFSFIIGANGRVRPCNLVTDHIFEKTDIYSHTDILKKGQYIIYDEELEKMEKSLNIEKKSLRNINCIGLGGKNENL